MRKTLLACALMSVTHLSNAADSAEVMAPVHHFFDALNKGDVDGAMQSCASNIVIVDEFAPFLWQGATSCKDWFNDFGLLSKKENLAYEKITLGKPSQLMVDGDKAYLVVPASFAFTLAGKHQIERGARIAAVLRRAPDGWAVSSWTWTTK